MRIAALAFAAVAVIISGCHDTSGVRGYWSSHTPDISDYAAAENEFADFALLAVQAPEKDAFAAIDMLLDKARKVDVTYLVYTDLIARGFSVIASPCHSCAIFQHAAGKILKQGILDGFAAEDYKLRLESCLHNRVGDRAEIPTCEEDPVALDVRTLFLVVDQDCPTCRESMQKFSGDEWSNTCRIALCYGRGPLPDTEEWECHRLAPDQTIIDTRQGPFYFVSSPNGTIEISYTPVNKEQ